MREAYVSAVKWPYHRLTTIGKLAHWRTCGGPAHVGIVITGCTDDEVDAHTSLLGTKMSAMGSGSISFDYVKTKRPVFQGLDDHAYFTGTTVELYKIEGVDVGMVHAACVEVARAKPRNSDFFKLNPLMGGCWCCSLGYSGDGPLPPSHCGSLVLRIVAAARAGDTSILYDDGEVLRQLGIPRGGLLRPCAPRRLTGFTPGSAVRALRRHACVASPQSRSEALDDRDLLPLLSLSLRS
jgi:hypothetical protein